MRAPRNNSPYPGPCIFRVEVNGVERSTCGRTRAKRLGSSETQATSCSTSSRMCVFVVRPPSQQSRIWVRWAAAGGGKLPAIIKASEIRDRRDCVEIKALLSQTQIVYIYTARSLWLFVCANTTFCGCCEQTACRDKQCF